MGTSWRRGGNGGLGNAPVTEHAQTTAATLATTTTITDYRMHNNNNKNHTQQLIFSKNSNTRLLENSVLCLFQFRNCETSHAMCAQIEAHHPT